MSTGSRGCCCSELHESKTGSLFLLHGNFNEFHSFYCCHHVICLCSLSPMSRHCNVAHYVARVFKACPFMGLYLTGTISDLFVCYLLFARLWTIHIDSILKHITFYIIQYSTANSARWFSVFTHMLSLVLCNTHRAAVRLDWSFNQLAAFQHALVSISPWLLQRDGNILHISVLFHISLSVQAQGYVLSVCTSSSV